MTAPSRSKKPKLLSSKFYLFEIWLTNSGDLSVTRQTPLPEGYQDSVHHKENFTKALTRGQEIHCLPAPNFPVIYEWLENVIQTPYPQGLRLVCFCAFSPYPWIWHSLLYLSLAFAEEVWEMSPYKSLTTPSLCTPDKWQFESLPTKVRSQGGFHFQHRWDFTKPAKFPKSNMHFTLKAVWRKGASLQCQASDEWWNKHLPKGNTSANQLTHSNCRTQWHSKQPSPLQNPASTQDSLFQPRMKAPGARSQKRGGAAQKRTWQSVLVWS